MTGLEIFLLITGIAIMAVSFLFGEQLDAGKGGVPPFDEEKIKSKVKAHIDKAVDEAVEEVIDEVLEKTEAELDKISNDKIMAVGDYSESVLDEIKKNHEEVMFLYGMLNDKEEQIKNTVKDVEMLKASVKKMLQAKEKAHVEKKQKKEVAEPETATVTKPVEREVKELKEVKEQIGNETPEIIEEIPEELMNNNQKILVLYQKGMSNIDIAKELNLGLGEVRLVIDLYRTRGRE